MSVGLYSIIGDEEDVLRNLAVRVWYTLVETTKIESSMIKLLPKENFFANLMRKLGITEVYHSIASFAGKIWSSCFGTFFSPNAKDNMRTPETVQEKLNSKGGEKIRNHLDQGSSVDLNVKKEIPQESKSNVV